MSGIAITIESKDLDAAIAKADELGALAQSADLRLIAGRAMQQAVSAHLFALAQDSAHHVISESLGAERTGFYEDAAQAAENPGALQAVPDGALLSIAQEGLAQRYFGGTIEAKAGSFLTIPAQAQAYGHRAREFSNLRLIMFPSGLAALIDKDEPEHEGGVMYWLVRSVTQAADPTVLPTEDAMLDPAITAVRDQISTVFERRAA